MSLYDYDLRMLQWINHHRIPGSDNFFSFITDTAGVVAIIIALLVIAIGFIKKAHFLKYRKYQVAFAYSVNAFIINILKYSINRPRPFEANQYIEKLTGGGSPSFPSGHTGDVMVVAISLTLLFPKKFFLLTLIWIWAILVSYSRMALGAHYPSDVLGAIVISLLVAFSTEKVFNHIQNKNRLL